MRWRGPDKKRFFVFLAILGPGIITASVDNDAGGIATYSIAGAHFGKSLRSTSCRGKPNPFAAPARRRSGGAPDFETDRLDTSPVW